MGRVLIRIPIDLLEFRLGFGLPDQENIDCFRNSRDRDRDNSEQKSIFFNSKFVHILTIFEIDMDSLDYSAPLDLYKI